MDRKLHSATIALHTGYKPQGFNQTSAVPIYLTTSYLFENSKEAADLFAGRREGHIYSRISNPTNDVLEKRVAELEGGCAAVSVASGLAAIVGALLPITNVGDEIISADNLYGGTYVLFEHTFANLGRKVRFAPSDDLDAVRNLVNEKTRAIFVEAIGNPKLDVPDLEELAKIAHEAGVPLIVDNTIGIGLMRPLDFGADIEVVAATKYLAGHGTVLAGLIIDSGRFAWNNGKFPMLSEPDPGNHNIVFWDVYNHPETDLNLAYAAKVRSMILYNMGYCLSPFDAFQVLQGCETLPLRQIKHSENAMVVAKFLENHPCVSWVNYPGLDSSPYKRIAGKYLKNGFGGMIGFGIKGGAEAGARFIDSVKLLLHLANLGDAKSLVVHPATTTHSFLTPDEQRAAGVSPDFIRFSVGLEDAEDIMADLDQALRNACG